MFVTLYKPKTLVNDPLYLSLCIISQVIIIYFVQFDSYIHIGYLTTICFDCGFISEILILIM